MLAENFSESDAIQSQIPPKLTVSTYNAIDSLSENTDTYEHESYNDQPVVSATEWDIDTT